MEKQLNKIMELTTTTNKTTIDLEEKFTETNESIENTNRELKKSSITCKKVITSLG